MAINNVGSSNLRIPDYEELNWHTPLNTNFNILAARNNINGGRRVVDGFVATDVGSGQLNISSGYIFDKDFYKITGGSYAIPTNTARIVYVNASGNIQVSATLPAIGSILLFYVTNVSNVLTVSDIATYYQPAHNYTNFIINGNFFAWTRATSQASTGYGSDDRWLNNSVGSTKMHERLGYLAGEAASLGTISPYYSRTTVSSVAGASNYVIKVQKIPGVEAFSGRTVTLAFLSRSNATRNIAISALQNFGTGGSTPINVPVEKIAITTAWARYKVTFDIPSSSGKTIGTNDSLDIYFWFDAGSTFNGQTNSLGQQSGIFDIGDVRLVNGYVDPPADLTSPFDNQARCSAFYENASNGIPKMGNQLIATKVRSQSIFYKVKKIKVPVITVGALTAAGHDGTPGSFDVAYTTLEEFLAQWNWTGGTAGRAMSLQFTWAADAEY